jgi:hypothetical protein
LNPSNPHEITAPIVTPFCYETGHSGILFS